MAVAYGRYSTEHQDASSLEYQIGEIQKFCARNNIPLTNFYFDEAKSGTNTNRQGFQNLMSAARQKVFDTVVIYDITRGSRDVADWFAFRKQMAELGIRVLSVSDKLGDIYNPGDFLQELITVGIGQHQVLSTRAKSMDSVAIKAKNGEFLGGCPPLGYDIVNGLYVINEKEAQIVRTIFTLYAKGESYEKILCAISGATGKRGRPIGKNSLNSILKNERYIGVYTWNKRVVKLLGKWAGGKPNPNAVRIEGRIPPIIDKKIWNEVQKRMKENKNATNRAKIEYLLSGLIECGQCGASYVGHTSTNSKGYRTRYYVCGNKYRTHTCRAKNINADEIETFVMSQLKEYFLTVDYDKVAEDIANQGNSASPDLKSEKKELAEVSIKIKNGMKAILGGMEFPELQEEIDNLRVRKSQLEDIIARREINQSKVDKKDIINMFKDDINLFGVDNRTLIKSHISKIYANGDGTFSITVGVHINGCGGRI